jgi:hypothetical protein
MEAGTRGVQVISISVRGDGELVLVKKRAGE